VLFYDFTQPKGIENKFIKMNVTYYGRGFQNSIFYAWINKREKIAFIFTRFSLMRS